MAGMVRSGQMGAAILEEGNELAGDIPQAIKWLFNHL